MGVEYAAAIWIGRPRKDIAEDKLSPLLEADELEVCPPYYDGNDSDFAIVGYSLQVSPDYSPVELDINQDEVDKRKRQFVEATGVEAKVYLSPMGW
jgi:hypothetical protein